MILTSATPAFSAPARGAALALLAAVSFSTVGVLSTLAFHDGANVITLLASRHVLCAALLWAVVLACRVGLPAQRDALLVLGLGFGLFAVQSGVFFSSLQRIPPSVADMLMFVYPALVTAGAVLLRRERADRRRVASMVVALLGVSIVVAAGASAGLDAIGAGLALAAALGYATYLLLTEGVVRRNHPIALTALLSTGAATAYLTAGLAGIGGGLDLHVQPRAWLLVPLIAVCGTVLPFLAFAAATRSVGASTASIMATAQVPVTIVLAAVVLGQTPTAVQYVGGALVLLGVAILQARPLPARVRRFLRPSRAVPALRRGVERALPERRPERGRPVRRAAGRLRRPLTATARRATATRR
jgi:drug/metabolite transporter (DMT)-like permease